MMAGRLVRFLLLADMAIGLRLGRAPCPPRGVAQRRGLPPAMVATAATAPDAATPIALLSGMTCAAAATDERGDDDGPLDVRPWRRAFRALASDASFVDGGFGRAAFKLDERWPFAVGSFTMTDVAHDVTRMPPTFVASGVRHNGGIYNQPFASGFTFADLDARMDAATVVLLNAGFLIPKLAAISLAMLEATQLPIWMNVYLSKPGLATSTQLHTDTQDVLLVQSTGRKRWRVYRPPPPEKTPALDPFARGKGTDHMEFVEADLLIDTVMEPGQVLFIPAGFPHTTDTILEPVEDAIASQPSVHLTVGVDTHLWSLSYAHMRAHALRRAGQPAALGDGAPVTTLPPAAWSLLHAPLPVGFLAAQHAAPRHATADEAAAAATHEDEAAAAAAPHRAAGAAPAFAAASAARAAKAAEMAVEGLAAGADRKEAKRRAMEARRAAREAAAAALAAQAAAEPALCEAMGASLASRLLATEPARWAGTAAADLAAELRLADAARRFVQHHRDVLGVQADMYLRAAYEAPATDEARRAFTNVLMQSMDALDAHAAALTGWASAGGDDAAAAKPSGFGAAGGGGGMGAGAKKKPAKKKAGGKKKR